ncbi:type II toxin-antitoxin system RelE/ParE family toxin [Adlercreutzia sp.]|uniref:type II toxin-antitoxin system RelE/ParE family toxin n=1 Tax=Adlercreutzia sp. TaxID=1872387 RepID=UPI003AAC2644
MRIVKSPRYEKWVSSLRDRNVIARISARNLQIKHYGALTGDWKAVGDGVFELGFHFGAGYRVYIALEGATLLLLLVGGTKSSQTKDIKLAKEIYESWRCDHE